MDVVLYTSQMIDLVHVFVLAPHQHGDVVIHRGAEIIHQSHIARLTGVAILGVIGFAAGHIVEHEQRAVVPLSPITGQQHGNLVFIVGTHGLQEPIVPQQIFIVLISGQFQGSVRIFFSIQTLSYLGDPKLLKGKGVSF